jgi:ABC-type cobalamin/Fe3+-siderophores transport system ATPase subunit
VTASTYHLRVHSSTGQSEILELLHTTASLRGLMVLTGSPGAGKSTLLKSWSAGLEPKRFLALLITQSSLSGRLRICKALRNQWFIVKEQFPL